MDINVKNQDFLSKQLFYTGFGEEHRFELGEAMASLDATKDSFSLTHKEKINDVDTFTRLNFVRTKGESGMVFFNSYDLTLNELGKEPLTQNFRIQKWQAMDLKIDGQNVIIDGKQEERKVNSTLTKKEAFNAMQGRYPLKEFIKEEEGKERAHYMAHIKIDFDQKLDKGGFKTVKLPVFGFEDKLNSIPVKDIDKEVVKKNLVESLGRGNLQSVPLIIGGAEVKHFLAVDAATKTIAIYDSNMERLGYFNTKEVKQDNSVKNETAGDKKIDQAEKKNDKRQRKGLKQ